MEGTTVGGYQLGRRLGSGATATVFEGIRPGLERPVAVKLFHPELAENKDLLERFRREARALGVLTHPNVVRFVEFVEAAPNYLFVMELLDGGTLADFLKQAGKVEERWLLPWVKQLAAALAAAHEKKIVHRDVKPANIFITTQGRLVLSDFGLARPEGDQLTVAGTKHLGTPLYMAPEQIVGRQATPATDIYQAGLVFHEMVTGQLPFPGGTPYDKLMARLTQDLTLPAEAAASDQVREIIRRSGFHDPALRYPDGNALLGDISAAMKGKLLPFMPPVKLNSDVGPAPVHQDDDWKDASRYPGTMLVVPKVNMQYDPRGKPFFVGSDTGVEVYLASPEIAPRQLRITPGQGVWSLESGNFKAELRLNGTAVQAGRYALKHGDLIELGNYSMLWVDQPREAQPASQSPDPGAGPEPAMKPGPASPGKPPRAGCAGALLALAGSLGMVLAGIR